MSERISKKRRMAHLVVAGIAMAVGFAVGFLASEAVLIALQACCLR